MYKLIKALRRKAYFWKTRYLRLEAALREIARPECDDPWDLADRVLVTDEAWAGANQKYLSA